MNGGMSAFGTKRTSGLISQSIEGCPGLGTGGCGGSPGGGVAVEGRPAASIFVLWLS